MFFNKVKEVKNTEAPVSTVAETITEIHNSFDNAADVLLKEAQDAVENYKIDEYSLLKKELGFTNAKGVKEADEALGNKEHCEKLAKNIVYFQQQYPAYKVITEDMVANICKKYNLVMADSSHYTGDIPSKNLLEIKKFNEFKEQINPEDNSYKMINYEIWSMDWRSTTYNHYQQAEVIGGNDRWAGGKVYTRKEEVFQICAPISDMNPHGMQLKGHKLVPIPDPIVLYPLRDNLYFVVTKWGLEGNDNSLTNEKMN